MKIENGSCFGVNVNTILAIIQILFLIFGGLVGYGQLMERLDQIDKRHMVQMEFLSKRLERIENYVDKGIVIDTQTGEGRNR